MKRFFILLILAMGFLSAATAQNSITLRFTGENSDNTYVQLDSVVIQNISRNWRETLVYPDTTLTMDVSTGIEENSLPAFDLSLGRSDWWNGSSQVRLSLSRAGETVLEIYDIGGRRLASHEQNLPSGVHLFNVKLPGTQICFLRAITPCGTVGLKMPNVANGDRAGIEYDGYTERSVENAVHTKLYSSKHFEIGDRMQYTGYSNRNGINYASQTYTHQPGESSLITLRFNVNNFSDETFTVNGVSFTMIGVPGGTFYMGAQRTYPNLQNYDSVACAAESPVHQVTLDSYYIGETEVTQALWYAVTGQRPTSGGYQWYSDLGFGDDYPAYFISWDDIQSFLLALNAATASQRHGRTFAMPTEAQWEFAARGGNSSHGYKYAGSNSIGNVAWYADNAYSVGSDHPDYGTHPVKDKSPNELGLYDMSGNVWEWCKDWYGSYGSDSQTNPTGPSAGSGRVLRGGSWYYDATYCRVSIRDDGDPDYRGDDYGFRLVLLP